MYGYATRKLGRVGIKYSSSVKHHIRVGKNDLYPTTGKFQVGGRWYEPDQRDRKSLKRQIRKFILMVSEGENFGTTPNAWSTGLAVPPSVTFHHPDGTVEFIQTNWRSEDD